MARTAVENVSQTAIDAHAAMLAEKVFQVDTKWPHFRLLLADIRELAAQLPAGATVVSLERGLLYGGISLFAPFFSRHTFVSVDSSPASADQRGAYNRSMIDDPRCIPVRTTHRAPIEATGLATDLADLVIVPNLVHHIADQSMLFAELARITKPDGLVYVFEPMVRELHQVPDDFLRYTPFGLRRELEAAGLVPGAHRQEGGPFSAIAYCWTQALQYFPAEKRTEMERWFSEEHFPQLLRWDAENPNNLVRQHTSFPMSFSLTATKPR